MTLIAKLEIRRSDEGHYRVTWKQEDPPRPVEMIDDGHTSLGAVLDSVGRRIALALRARKGEE